MFAKKTKAILDFLEKKNVRVIEAASCDEKSLVCRIPERDIKNELSKCQEEMKTKFDIRILNGGKYPFNASQSVIFESKELRKI